MKKVLIGLAVLLVVAAAGAAGVWWFLEKRLSEFVATPFGTADAKVVEIPTGTNARGIGALLEREHVISSGELFYSYVKHEKMNPAKLKAGEYEFSGALTPPQVIEKIVRGEVKQYHFTIAEGLRVDEIAPILVGSELKLSAEKLAALLKSPDFLRKHGVPADSAEGFLFPDTYSFPRGATEEQVLTKMIGRTLEEFKRAPRKAGVDFDVLQGITLASIVEKETGAREPEARPHFSCVFHNRLRLKMKLQTDPTVLYAKYLSTGQFSKNITRADLQAEHPYNTYTTKGLPPGPIASPGAPAIQAALNPIDCNDLFFVSRNDGTSIFCPDLKCHERNVDAYQRGISPGGGTDETGTKPQPQPVKKQGKKRAGPR